MYVINQAKSLVKSWCNDIEDEAMKQIRELANLPFVYKHVAIMPDCHAGKGMPIGGVLATKDVIIPNAVGVDIGCGMCAIKTNLKVSDLPPDVLKKIMAGIRHVIPLGRNWNDVACDDSRMPTCGNYLTVVSTLYKDAKLQMGSLGGGNHFIEIQKDADENVWIMIHSGSRNLGKKVAEYYHDLAFKLNCQWHSGVPKELAFLPINSKEGKDYLNEMQYCVEFAFANRVMMIERILAEVKKEFPSCQCGDLINIAHNYATLENHFGENVMVHRKGATRVRTGEIGIIPGSQGSKSYIVEGLGNPESFNSCSHGAGRKLSRSKAKAELDINKEILDLNAKGIIHSIRTHDDLDEAAGAYKDIDTVMESQKDLVTIKVELSPMGVIKG